MDILWLGVGLAFFACSFVLIPYFSTLRGEE